MRIVVAVSRQYCVRNGHTGDRSFDIRNVPNGAKPDTTHTHTQHTEHSVLCVSVGPVHWIWSRSCMKRKWAVPFRCNSFISTRNRIFWHRDGEIFVVLVSDASGTPSMLDILDHWLCLFVWCIEFLFSSKNKQRPAKYSLIIVQFQCFSFVRNTFYIAIHTKNIWEHRINEIERVNKPALMNIN